MHVQSGNPYAHLIRYQQPAPERAESHSLSKPGHKPTLTHAQLTEKPQKLQEDSHEEEKAIWEMSIAYLGEQSRRMQWEIYLSGITGEKVDLGGGEWVRFYNTLRDIREQNNAVKAYAAYRENALEA